MIKNLYSTWLKDLLMSSMMVLDILMASTSLCDAIALTAIWTSKKVIALAMTGLVVAIGFG